MLWSDYYEKYDGWQERAQYNLLSTISDFGPNTSPSCEIADCAQCVDDITAARLIRFATRAGVQFTSDEVVEILESSYLDEDEDVINALIASSDESTYSAELLERLLNALPDEAPALPLIDRICQRPNDFKDTELISLVETLFDEDRAAKLLLTNSRKFSRKTLTALADTSVDDDVLRAVSKRSGIPYSYLFEEEDTEPVTTHQAPQRSGGVGLLGVLFAVASGLADGASDHRHSGHCDGDCANCPPHYGYRYGRWYYGHGHMHGCQFGGNRRGGSD